ncbi:MAG: GGDEF domain-containing protein [Jatrophihabitantaceae bacterium]
MVLARHTALHTHDLVLVAVLVGLGIAQAEIGRQTERLRRQLTDTAHINLTSVWTFAGVLLLPPVLVAVLVTILYVQLSVRSWYQLREITTYRAVMNTCFVIITCYLARGALELLGIHDIQNVAGRGAFGMFALGLALVVYFLTGALLVVPTIWARTRSVSDVVGTRSENFLELATLCLAAIVALLLVALPALSIAILPPLMILHRGLLNRELESTAAIDQKTGVLNAATWHYVARRELTQATGHADAALSILMIDLDHFKRVNDAHGHLNGDEVLKAVATCITGELRENDSVGRFGGEEFIVLLPRAREAEACKIAERIRYAVSIMNTRAVHAEGSVPITGLSVSIGVGTFPVCGTTVNALMHSADTALYRAKNDGRNRVVAFSGIT